MSCAACRRDYGEAKKPTPCEEEILPDGTCAFGMPETLRENQLAIHVWGDIQALGWQCTMDLMDLDLTREESEDLLLKLRFIQSELSAIERRRIEEQARKNRRRG